MRILLKSKLQRLYEKSTAIFKYFDKTQSIHIPLDDQFSGDKVYFGKFDDVGIFIDEKNPWAALKFAQLLANKEFMKDGREVNQIIEE